MFEEMVSEISNLKTNKIILKNFAITMFIVVSAFGIFQIYKENLRGWWFLIVGIFLLLLGIVMPKSLKVIYLFWMGLAIIIGAIISRLILTILFYGLFLPIGICLKIFRRDLLGQKIDPTLDSYWQKRETNNLGKQLYERPF